MKKQDAFLLSLIVLALLFSIGFTYHRTIIKGDFEAVDLEPATGEE